MACMLKTHYENPTACPPPDRRQANVSPLEPQIEQRVYAFYSLTPAIIKIVQEFNQ